MVFAYFCVKTWSRIFFNRCFHWLHIVCDDFVFVNLFSLTKLRVVTRYLPVENNLLSYNIPCMWPERYESMLWGQMHSGDFKGLPEKQTHFFILHPRHCSHLLLLNSFNHLSAFQYDHSDILSILKKVFHNSLNNIYTC